MTNADLSDAKLHRAVLIGANLNKTNCFMTDFSRANLTKTRLIATDLTEANLVNTIFIDAIIHDCRIYGVSVWETNVTGASQKDLVITPILDDSIITVDNLEVAQFIYILLFNEKIRHMIDEISSKVVLILGRFTPERKFALDIIREELRNYNLIPIIFDFKKPGNRDVIETASTLAHMARFVIADITDAKTVIQELDHIVPILPSVPVQPIILTSSEHVWAGYSHLKRKSPNLLKIFCYDDLDHLKKSLKEKVIEPAGLLRTKLIATK